MCFFQEHFSIMYLFIQFNSLICFYYWCCNFFYFVSFLLMHLPKTFTRFNILFYFQWFTELYNVLFFNKTYWISTETLLNLHKCVFSCRPLSPFDFTNHKGPCLSLHYTFTTIQNTFHLFSVCSSKTIALRLFDCILQSYNVYMTHTLPHKQTCVHWQKACISFVATKESRTMLLTT